MTPTETPAFGIHYTGRHAKDGTNTSGIWDLTDGGLVDQDLAYLWSKGFRKIRSGAPPFDYSRLQEYRQFALFLKSRGWYVQYAVNSNNTSTTSDERWELYKAALPTEVQWAQDNGMDAFSIGNEEDLHIVTTGLDAGQIAARRTVVRNDLRALGTMAKGIFTHGPITVSISTGNQQDWIDEYPTYGKSDFDRIDWNVYDSVNNFRTRINAIVTTFGINNIGITEFNVTNGYKSTNENSRNIIGNDEETYALDMVRRCQYLKSIGMQSFYFFSYTNSSGTVDQYDVRSNTNNNLRLAFEWMTAAMNGKRVRYTI